MLWSFLLSIGLSLLMQQPSAQSAAQDDPAAILGPSNLGSEWIGKPAPSLSGVVWQDGRNHPIRESKGKVVLLRWWTNTCPYCCNSAPALRQLAKEFGSKLEIRALFHEKPMGRKLGEDEIKESAMALGMPFLLGHDRNWTALQRWWLTDRKRRFTSVTFVLDKKGVIRQIHTGGEFHSQDQVKSSDCRRDPKVCAKDYAQIREMITLLLAEPSQAPTSADPVTDRASNSE